MSNTSNPSQPRYLAYIILVIGVLAVSSASLFIRLAQNEGASSLVISAWRIGLAALILTGPVLWKYGDDIRRLSRWQVGLGILSGLALGVHFAAWITSLEYTSVLTSTVLVTTNPLWVALLSPFLLKEKLSRVTILAIIIAIIGGIVISVTGDAGKAPRQDNPTLGIILSLVGAIAVTFNFILGRRLRQQIALLPYIWITYGTAAIALIMAVLFTRQPVTGLPSSAYVWMTVLALVPQLIGHSSYNYALGYMSAAFVSLSVLFEPVGSTILAAMYLDERPQLGQLLGGLLIMIGLYLASREEFQKANIKPEEPVL